MNDDLANKFYNDAIPEGIKNRVLDVFILADFETDDDDAVKIRVLVDELIPNSLITSGEFIPTNFEGHPVEVVEDNPIYERGQHKEPPFSWSKVPRDLARWHCMRRKGHYQWNIGCDCL